MHATRRKLMQQRRASAPHSRSDDFIHATLRRLDNLIMRYEEPSSMVRWDSPLFTVPWDEALPGDEIWKAVTEGNKKPPNAAVQAVSV